MKTRSIQAPAPRPTLSPGNGSLSPWRTQERRFLVQHWCWCVCSCRLQQHVSRETGAEPIYLQPRRYHECATDPLSHTLYTSPLLNPELQMFEVTTLGQPLEVIKTQMASNRQQTMPQAVKTVWSRGKLFGFYQGL